MILVNSECLKHLKTMADNSVDSIVTDPPYGIRFMSKKWDYDVPSIEIWSECLRVLKPGGHLLSFAGTRTQHRMCTNIEDAGFEIRDMIAWMYSTGFPKSHNISKAIDKQFGVEKIVEKGRAGKNALGQDSGYNITEPNSPEAKQWEGWGTALKPALETLTVARKTIIKTNETFIKTVQELIICLLKSVVFVAKKNFLLNQVEQKEVLSIVQWIEERNINTQEDLLEVMDMLPLKLMENLCLNIGLSCLNILKEICCLQNKYTTEMESNMIIELKILQSLQWENIFQNIINNKNKKTNGILQNVSTVENILNVLNVKLNFIKTHFVQENVILLEKQKDLSPNLEPITLARKPLSESTIAKNVLKWGTGGINIDGSRVGTEEIRSNLGPSGKDLCFDCAGRKKWLGAKTVSVGRFPANLIHDGSDEVKDVFPNSKSSNAVRRNKEQKPGRAFNGKGAYEGFGFNDSGSDARFFKQIDNKRFIYQHKANKKERGIGNDHPCVKPVKLMEYLINLITPPNGVVLDPFMGSGSTGIACTNKGFNFIGIEMDEGYYEIAKRRIKGDHI